MLCKGKVCAAHVIKGGGHWCFDGVISFATGLDIDHDLHWTVEAIQQSAKRVQPALAVILGGASKPQPSGFNNRFLACALPSSRGSPVGYSNR
jgi:hypothetical protein